MVSVPKKGPRFKLPLATACEYRLLSLRPRFNSRFNSPCHCSVSIRRSTIPYGFDRDGIVVGSLSGFS